MLRHRTRRGTEMGPSFWGTNQILKPCTGSLETAAKETWIFFSTCPLKVVKHPQRTYTCTYMYIHMCVPCKLRTVPRSATYLKPPCLLGEAYVMRYGRLKDFWVSSLGFRVLGGFKVVLGECYGKPGHPGVTLSPNPQP